PGRFPVQTTDALVSLVDLAPTFLSLAGVPLAPTLQGISLQRVLRGETARHREGVLTEFHSSYRPWLNLKTWRTTDWKLTYYAGQSWGELYDLRQDPDEFVNLYSRTEYAAVRDRLCLRLLEELVHTEDRMPPVESHA
ncbi:MAG: DUF4976 domain-containing protein, partial [SAR202 cluster bacterium]|nr:DUF4976 domain-containing protein [SAR202 cluster bacterium]